MPDDPCPCCGRVENLNPENETSPNLWNSNREKDNTKYEIGEIHLITAFNEGVHNLACSNREFQQAMHFGVK